MALDGDAPYRLSNVGGVLSFAIAKEEEAARRYHALAERVDDPALSGVLRALAAQEETHRVALQAVAAGAELTAFELNHLDTPPVSEITLVAEPGPDASLAHVLLYAIKAEHDAFQLYMALANASADPALVTLFQTLATEEKGHRTRLDRLYRTVAFGDA